MIEISVLLIVVIVVALAFDVTNGMHDTANSVGPMLATRSIGPRAAVAVIATANGAGALLASGAVAATIGTGIVTPEIVTLELVLAAIGGAICWNVLTWWAAIPCSSSLALVGALAGAGAASGGFGSVGWPTVIDKALVPSLIAPVVGAAIAMTAYVLITRSLRRAHRRSAERGLRKVQIGAAALQAFAHGTNDAQKTMGVIALALLAAGGGAAAGQEFHVPLWVTLACATSLTVGTLAGGWRIIRTMGRGLGKLDVPQGVSATFAGGVVLLLASRFGLPVSTTYATVGSIMGAAACRGKHRVGWSTGGDLVVAWAITVPCSAAMAALATIAVAISPLIFTAGVLALLSWMLVVNHRDGDGRARQDAEEFVPPAWTGAAAQVTPVPAPAGAGVPRTGFSSVRRAPISFAHRRWEPPTPPRVPVR